MKQDGFSTEFSCGVGGVNDSGYWVVDSVVGVCYFIYQHYVCRVISIFCVCNYSPLKKVNKLIIYTKVNSQLQGSDQLLRYLEYFIDRNVAAVLRILY